MANSPDSSPTDLDHTNTMTNHSKDPETDTDRSLAAEKPILHSGQRLFSPITNSDAPSQPMNVSQSRINEGPEQAKMRLEKMCRAVRTLLECIGEDPNREGLLATPSRYAKALLFLTKGYQSKAEDIINDALFCEGHTEIVIVKDIEIHSLCEHHLVPFTGKVLLTCYTIVLLPKTNRYH